jgi:hypothetical protein
MLGDFFTSASGHPGVEVKPFSVYRIKNQQFFDPTPLFKYQKINFSGYFRGLYNK